MNRKNIIYIAGAAAILFIGYLIWRDNKEKKEGNPAKEGGDNKNDSSSSSSGNGTSSSSSSGSFENCESVDLDFSKVLSMGSVGCEVLELQRLLNDRKTGSPESPLVLDGVFGSQTESLLNETFGSQQNSISLNAFYVFFPFTVF